MPQGEEAALGLNKNGLIVFIVLLILCWPLCWIPWVVDSMKAEMGGEDATTPEPVEEEEEEEEEEAPQE